jgi:GTP diphosphokinase / guanosine-3',5'-bis(diphosphate) 3'-diphosphatase
VEGWILGVPVQVPGLTKLVSYGRASAGLQKAGDRGQTSMEDDRTSLRDFIRALAFASRKHSQQRRKDMDASPYINHPIALVAILAVEAGINDRDTLCAALLHDTLEDTDTSVEELTEAFGSVVAALVQEVTDDKRLPKAERKRRQVEHAAHLSPKARLVKLADKIANLRDVADSPPADWPLARRQEYFDWAKQVVDQIPNPPPDLISLFTVIYQRRP